MARLLAFNNSFGGWAVVRSRIEKSLGGKKRKKEVRGEKLKA